MAIYWARKISELSDQALLDQHRSCHAIYTKVRLGQLRGKTLADLLLVHEQTVKEMLLRGMKHLKALDGDVDFPYEKRVNNASIQVTKTHPQMTKFSKCPICCMKSSITESTGKESGDYSCTFCGQIFELV